VTTVLVADDDRDIRDLVAFKLEAAGFEVLVAGDGDTALSTAVEHRPDVAVLDVMMPGMSGMQVLQQLRARADLSAVRVILLTAKAQEADVESGFSMGADDYVVKPFSPRELLSRVQAVLARSTS
jgi:DNA-binding response OmpR family regulator